MPFKQYVRLKGPKLGVDVVDKPPKGFHITNFDLFAQCYAILVHLIDVALDINLTVSYYKADRIISFSLTLLFFLFPSLIMTALSIRMYISDKSPINKSFYRIGLLLFQLAPVVRYMDSLKYALLSRRAEGAGDKARQEKYYRAMLSEDADVALLRVFDCYLETAPQQILQISLLLQDTHSGNTYHQIQQSLSISSSFLSMAVCMAGYQRAIRFDQESKRNISWIGSGFQFLWHLNVTVARILAISLLAFAYPYWTAFAIFCHWFVMTLWLSFIQNVAFCSTSIILKVLFANVLALVYIFNYVSVREGKTRNYYTFYYSLCFLENIAAVIVWVIFVGHVNIWYFKLLLSLVVTTSGLGILFMVIYYNFFHPTKYVQNTQ